MKTEEFVTEFETLCLEMIATMKRKNADYARGEDPFKNLRRHGTHGIVVRLDDKIARLDTLTDPRFDGVAQVKDESIEDTAKDAANYAILLIMLHRQLKREAMPPAMYQITGEEILARVGDFERHRPRMMELVPRQAIAEIPDHPGRYAKAADDGGPRVCSICPPYLGHNTIQEEDRPKPGETVTIGNLMPKTRLFDPMPVDLELERALSSTAGVTTFGSIVPLEVYSEPDATGTSEEPAEWECPEGCGHPLEKHPSKYGNGCLFISEQGQFCRCKYNPPAKKFATDHLPEGSH